MPTIAWLPFTRRMFFRFLFLALLIGGGIFAYLQTADAYPELAYLKERRTLTFPELSAYFSRIAKEKGALYAYDILRRATLPPNTDTHLLGHVVGDALYQEKGIEGIGLCTEEFRNACSHTIVIGVLTEEGEAGLPAIASACKQAPGGRGAYTMCFHGLGHGIFAYTDHDIGQTVALCRKTGTEAYQQREYIECFGGAVMELVGGTGHDKQSLEVARKRYLSEIDPLAPCDSPLVPEELKPICYTYLTPRLFTWEGGNLGAPTEEDFAKAFGLCERISRGEEESRRACFGGVGKELPTLAAKRDIRNIDELKDEKLALLHTWCALAKSEEGREHCVRAIVQSLFWGGENDPRAAISFCELASPTSSFDACFDELLRATAFYLSPSLAALICEKVPNGMRSRCTDGAAYYEDLP